jgi:hypothetical protein
MDDDEDGAAGDAVARATTGPARSRARVLDEDRRGLEQRGRGDRLRRVGPGWVAVVQERGGMPLLGIGPSSGRYLSSRASWSAANSLG